jgi:hypothetical protein
MRDAPDREARLRRLATGQGLILQRLQHARLPLTHILYSDPRKADEHLPDGETRSPLDVLYRGYVGTLDDIEAFLMRGQAGFKSTQGS